MTQRRARPAIIAPLLLTLLLLPAPAAAAADDALLAVVNGEHVTLKDLDVELFLMKSQAGRADLVLPAADAVLQRLIQNTLLFQEGRRLGLHEDPKVLNQVNENVRYRSVLALVDSVALSVPVDVADRKDRQFQAIDAFVEGLKKTYGVEVDQELLESLDYASSDPAVQDYLRNSEDVLCMAPTGAMRVRSLTRTILFQEFHGMEGRADAAQVRDECFRDWVSEAVLTYEARRQGIPEKPEMKTLAAYHTRDLVLQETLGVLATVQGEPTEEELRAFYEANIEHVTPPARLKVESTILENEEAARLFKQRLDQGAEMGWLADRTTEVLENVAALPATWLLPGMIGLQPGQARVGLVLEPLGVPGGWVVAKIVEMEDTQPVPLEECRDEVLRRLRGERTTTAVTDAVRKLKDAAVIEIVPDAEALVADHLVEWERKNNA